MTGTHKFENISFELVSSSLQEHLEILCKKFQLSVEKKEAKKAAKNKRKASAHGNVGKKMKPLEEIATEPHSGHHTTAANSEDKMIDTSALLVQKENAAIVAATQEAAAPTATVSTLQQYIFNAQLTNQSNYASQLALNQVLISKARACAAEVQKALKESADANIAAEALLDIGKTDNIQKHERGLD